MNQHTPTIESPATFACPACAWRAVLANDGRLIQSVPGDGGHDHIGQALKLRDELYAHIDQAFHRLRKHYADGDPLPERNDNCEDLIAAGCADTRRLNVAQLQRLYRCVTSEVGL